jgi:hypothetical protein
VADFTVALCRAYGAAKALPHIFAVERFAAYLSAIPLKGLNGVYQVVGMQPFQG